MFQWGGIGENTMVGVPYDGGQMRLGATIAGETINFTDDDIYLALMKSTYVQDVRQSSLGGHEHWKDIKTYEIDETGTYVSGGTQLTMAEPYVEATLYHPFRYLVYTANAAATPIAYSVSFSGVTFTDITGAVIYKKGVEVDGSDWPLFTFISELSARTTDDDKYWVKFGNPGVTLGFYAILLGVPAPSA